MRRNDAHLRSGGSVMVARRLFAAILVAALVLVLSVPVFAQDYDYSYVCEDMRNSFFIDGGANLNAADLLSCGMSPEAIGAQPSINGPYGVGRENEFSSLPLGSPEAKSCYEWLIWSMGY